eukprot:4644319-Pleurochrysis_carterae.AAC.1
MAGASWACARERATSLGSRQARPNDVGSACSASPKASRTRTAYRTRASWPPRRPSSAAPDQDAVRARACTPRARRANPTHARRPIRSRRRSSRRGSVTNSSRANGPRRAARGYKGLADWRHHRGRHRRRRRCLLDRSASPVSCRRQA